MYTTVGNSLHGMFLNGAGMGAMSHIGSGAGIGAGLGAVNAMVTGNDTMIGGGMSGAVTGAMLGAGTRFMAFSISSTFSFCRNSKLS
jgi:hypothetical protein